jgi:hypothetical protein
MPALKFGLKEVCLEGLTLFPCRAASRTAEKERHVARDADAQSVVVHRTSSVPTCYDEHLRSLRTDLSTTVRVELLEPVDLHVSKLQSVHLLFYK